MKAPPIPKWTLVHTVDYAAFSEMDDYGNNVFAEPVTIERVRVDETPVFSHDGIQKQLVANAVIFVDAMHSKPFVAFTEQSQIIFKEREMVIQKVIPCYQPGTDEIHHYELEVL